MAEEPKGTNRKTRRAGVRAALVALCLLPAAASATDIWTWRWGYFWKNPLPNDLLWKFVQPEDTPGSDSFDGLRIRRPAMYAFLDGFDTRRSVAERSGALPPNLEPNTNVFARFLAQREFVSRKNDLRNLKCGNGNVIWGSTKLDEMLKDEGLPQRRNFGWQEDPWDYVMTSDGTAWLPCFRSLYDDDAFDADGYYDRLEGGLAMALGWWDVLVWERNAAHTTFSDKVYDAFMRGASPAHPYSFTDLISHAFETSAWLRDEDADPLYHDTASLLCDQLGTADQTLALMDKTYHAPGAYEAITNYANVTATAVCTVKGPLRGVVRVFGGGRAEVRGPGGAQAEDVWADVEPYARTYQTTSLVYSCSLTAPRLCVSGVSHSYGAELTLTPSNPVSSTPVEYEQLLPAIAELFGGEVPASGAFWVVPRHPGGSYVLSNEFGVTTTKSVSPNPPAPGDYEAEAKCSTTFTYYWDTALDIHLHHGSRYLGGGYGSGGDAGIYPTNTTFVSPARGINFTFFNSAAFVRRTIDIESDEINFDYDTYWRSSPQWAYSAFFNDRGAATSGNGYIDWLKTDLQLSAAKCRTYMDANFETPTAYLADAMTDAEHWMQNITKWTVSLASSPLDPTKVTLSEGGMEPAQVLVCSTSLAFGGTTDEPFYTDSLPPAGAVTTKVKGIVEANWDFPQQSVMDE